MESEEGLLEGMVKMKNIWKDKIIFIIGANGFLGAHLTRQALVHKAKVIALIKEEMPLSLFSIEKLNKKVELIKADLRDSRLINVVFKENKIDLCLHVAAQAIVGIANKSPIRTLETNIEGTWNILEAGRIHGVAAVVVASSDKAYGEHKRLPYTEEASLQPLHPYDASKACADILSRTFAHTYNLPIAVTRCANIYGAGDFNFSRIIPDTMRSVINGENPVIRSNGSPLRDYIYIKDVVNAYFTLADKLYLKEIKFGEAFNFGTGKPVSVLNLVKRIINLSGKNNLKPLILGKGKTKGEIDKQYLSSKKAKKILGWKPEYTLEQGLKETYKWYKAHL